MSSLTKEEIEALDPYSFLAALGKRVVRPGGHVSTEQLFELAEIKPTDHVLEVGCGVGATAIELVQRFGCEVTAIDHSRLMLEKAEELTRAAGLVDRIHYQEADMCGLPYEDDTFDVVVIEAVTMFCPRIQAISECNRVLKPGGRFVCVEHVHSPSPGGLRSLQHALRTPWRWLFEGCDLCRDTGATLARAGFAQVEVKQSVWLMRNIMEIMPSLGYVVVSARKPALVPRESKASS